MGTFATDALNDMLDASFATSALFASLHSGFPGRTDASAVANEIAGGVPPYTREAVTWGPAAAGELSAVTLPSFEVPAGTTVSWLGLWRVVSGELPGDEYRGCAPLGGGIPVPFTAEDSTDFLTADNHGFANGATVTIIDTSSAVIPTGLVEGTTYFVRDVTTDTLKLALTSGGAAIDLTSDGAGFLTSIVPETFGGAGQLDIPSLVMPLTL